jgi:copper oxidase (laccase) domain-containing protein
MKIKIFSKSSQEKNPNFLDWVIVPDQTHSKNIIEIISWKEDLTDCDWIFTSRKNNFKLAIKTADCSAITFYDEKKYWIIHAGWRW